MIKQLILALLALAAPAFAADTATHAANAGKEAKAAVVAGAEKAGDAVKAGGKAVEAAADKAAAVAKAMAAKAARAAEAEAAKVSAAALSVADDAVKQTEPFQAMKEGAFDHMHNKIVHFPIALGFFGAIFLLLSFWYPSYKWPARVLLFFAGSFGVAALFTGQAQEAAFDGTSFTEVLAWHKRAGQVTAGLIWGAFILSFFEASRKFFWLYALLLFWFLMTAGALGGLLASA